eukprot:TRINITY_DN5253_c0_g2_i2.p1 TRINITY_DN5253_c0_g2~~TRINITY_DN5253_c0_g2_i2.p1  ORF type:complete len:1014 (+),score=191.90 TRINITY_DN5253_c0_g2_i2:21-3062(+)
MDPQLDSLLNISAPLKRLVYLPDVGPQRGSIESFRSYFSDEKEKTSGSKGIYTDDKERTKDDSALPSLSTRKLDTREALTPRKSTKSKAQYSAVNQILPSTGLLKEKHMTKSLDESPKIVPKSPPKTPRSAEKINPIRGRKVRDSVLITRAEIAFLTGGRGLDVTGSPELAVVVEEDLDTTRRSVKFQPQSFTKETKESAPEPEKTMHEVNTNEQPKSLFDLLQSLRMSNLQTYIDSHHNDVKPIEDYRYKILSLLESSGEVNSCKLDMPYQGIVDTSKKAPMELPTTAIPEKYHVKADSSVTLPEKFRTPALTSQFDIPGRKWKTTLFPSALPSSRQEVIMLQLCYEQMISDLETMNLPALVYLEERKKVYQVCIQEVVRQVSVHCADRGAFLAHIVKELFEVHNKELFGLEDNLKKLYSMQAHTRKDYEERILYTRTGYRDEISESIRRLQKDHMVQLKRINESFEAEKKNLVAVRDKKIEELQSTIEKLSGSRSDIISMTKKAEAQKYADAIQELEDEIRHLKDTLVIISENHSVDLVSYGLDMEMSIQRPNQTTYEMNGSASEEIRKQTSDIGIQVNITSGGVDASSQTGLVVKKTDFVQKQKPSANANAKQMFNIDEFPLSWVKLFQLCRQGTGERFSKRFLLKTIIQIFHEKHGMDEMRENLRIERLSMPQFVMDFFCKKYGLRQQAEKRLIDFIDSVLFFSKTSRRFASFIEYCGLLSDEVSAQYSYLYGYLLSILIRDPHGWTGMDHPDGRIFITLSRSNELIKSLFDTVENVSRVATEVDVMSQHQEVLTSHGPKVELVVDWDDFIDLCLTTWMNSTDYREGYFLRLFKAADIDGNGVVSEESFGAIAWLVFPQCTQDQIGDWYEMAIEMTDEKVLQIKQFIDVATTLDFLSSWRPLPRISADRKHKGAGQNMRSREDGDESLKKGSKDWYFYIIESYYSEAEADIMTILTILQTAGELSRWSLIRQFMDKFMMYLHQKGDAELCWISLRLLLSETHRARLVVC